MYDNTCKCQFGSSFYPFAIQSNDTYDLTMYATMPKKSRVFFFTDNPNEWLRLQIFYNQPLKIRPYINGEFSPDWERDAVPATSEPHGIHAQNPQERRFYIMLRGGVDGMTLGQSIFLQTIEVVKVSMTLDVPVSEFDGDDFVSNLATLLQIDPTRIRVVDVQPSARLLRAQGTAAFARALASGLVVDFEIDEDPPAPSADELGLTLVEPESAADELTVDAAAPVDPFAPPTPPPTPEVDRFAGITELQNLARDIQGHVNNGTMGEALDVPVLGVVVEAPSPPGPTKPYRNCTADNETDTVTCVCASGYWGSTCDSICEPCVLPEGMTGYDGEGRCNDGAEGDGLCIFECATGFFNDNSTIGACSPCPVNRWSLGGNKTACAPCPLGSFRACPDGALACPHEGTVPLEICELCPAGTYHLVPGDPCIPCAEGLTSGVIGATNASVCEACPAGGYCPAGAASWTVCPQGAYCPAGVNAPILCPLGTASPATNASTNATCIPCQPGFFSCPSLEGCAFCFQCPPGTTGRGGSGLGKLEDACSECPSGQFGGPGLEPCSPCPENTFSTGRAAECDACPQGETAPSGAEACEGAGLAGSALVPIVGVCVVLAMCVGGAYYLKQSKTKTDVYEAGPDVEERAPIAREPAAPAQPAPAEKKDPAPVERAAPKLEPQEPLPNAIPVAAAASVLEAPQEEEPAVPEEKAPAPLPRVRSTRPKSKYPAEPKPGVAAQVFEPYFDEDDGPLGADFAWTVPPEIVAVEMKGSAREMKIKVDDKVLGVNGVDAANLSRDEMLPVLEKRPLMLRIVRGKLPARELFEANEDLLLSLPPAQPAGPAAQPAPPEHVEAAVIIQRFLRGRYVRRNFLKCLEKGGHVSEKFLERFAEGRAERTAVMTMLAAGVREKAERVNHNRQFGQPTHKGQR